MPEINLQTAVENYLTAFAGQDIETCVALFAPDAKIDFGMGVFSGREGILEWHKDRFAAELKIIRLDKIETQGNTVIVDGAVTSNLIRAWRFKSLKGRATLVFEGDKIKSATFGLRSIMPVEGW